MDRKTFRKARLAVLKDVHCDTGFGWSDHVPGYKAALRLFLNNRTDNLAARLSPFTPDARSRIKLYPLFRLYRADFE